MTDNRVVDNSASVAKWTLLSRITGFGIVRAERHQVDYIECGCIRLGSGELDQRLRYLHEQLSAIIEQFHPAEVAIERVFMNRNADSALKLGHARGVAIVAASLNGAEVSEYSATQIKQTVVGRGHADKQQVQHMVSALLKLEKSRFIKGDTRRFSNRLLEQLL